MSSESSQARTAAGMELVSTPPQSVIRPRKGPATPRDSSTSPSVGDRPRSAPHQVRMRRCLATAYGHDAYHRIKLRFLFDSDTPILSDLVISIEALDRC